MERVCENTTSADFRQNKLSNYIPVIRSGDWSDIGGRQYMEDAHVCIPDLAKNFGFPSLNTEVVSFYGVTTTGLPTPFYLFPFFRITQYNADAHNTHTHPYEYTYANPTSMSTSEGPSTDRSRDSRSHHWHLVVDGNVGYHLTHNAGKSRNKSRKRCEHQDLNPVGSVPLDCPTIGLQAHSPFYLFSSLSDKIVSPHMQIYMQSMLLVYSDYIH
jgi:hypothetical protein